jgi:hypothetical protein
VPHSGVDSLSVVPIGAQERSDRPGFRAGAMWARKGVEPQGFAPVFRAVEVGVKSLLL